MKMTSGVVVVTHLTRKKLSHGCHYLNHTKESNVDKLIQEIHNILLENKVTIKATSEADLLIVDEETGEERVYPDLGYPI